jgi:hypothetical protein
MPDSISWSFNAVSSSGGTAKSTGKTDADATLSATKKVKKTNGNEALKFQLDTASSIAFLAVTSTFYHANLTIKASGAGATEVPLTGPFVLHGGALALFAADLTTLTVKNTSSTDAEVTVLIGLNLA